MSNMKNKNSKSDEKPVMPIVENSPREIIKNSHSILIQGNEISRGMYACSVLARKIIAYGAVRITEKEIDISPWWSELTMRSYIPYASFKISTLLKALNLTDCGQNYILVKNAVQELRGSCITIRDVDDEYRAFNWFDSVHFNKKKDLIELEFAQNVGWALYNWKDGFSRMSLDAIGGFKSFYAFRFYEIAMSWSGNKGHNGNAKGCWWFEMNVETIRKTFQIQDTAYQNRMENFIRKVITDPCKEINQINGDIIIEPVKIKEGRKTIGFRFECKEKTEQLEIKRTNSPEVKAEKIERNEDEKFIAKYQKRFDELFEEEKKIPCLFGQTSEMFARANAILRLKEEYGKQ